tara:strand:+ start:9198 stop:9734 length:537 start_codon:yes stop_codon:yes gene_type:complete
MNTYNLSISSTKDDINQKIILNDIDLFDLTEVTLDISNIYTEIFPNYLSIDWGDGSPTIQPDIKIYRDYKTESIFPELDKGVTPVTFSNSYTHRYFPSSYALKKAVTFKMNVGYITGETLQLSAPLVVNSQSYYENVDDIDIIGLDLINDVNNSSRVSFITKKNNYIVQLDNKTYKEN